MSSALGFAAILPLGLLAWSLTTVVLCREDQVPKGTVKFTVSPNFNLSTPVNQSQLWKKKINGLDALATATLKPFYDYQFLLPEQSLRAGLGYVGAARRLRNFVQDLALGQRPLKIGILGGSISHGMLASRKGTTDWFSIFVNWLASVNKAPVSSRNGCRPATPSSYMVFCLEDAVDSEVDLVLVEYSLNDGYVDSIAENDIVKAKEQLLRRVLKLPRRPAIVMMQIPHVWPESIHPFWYTPEDAEGALAAYYDVSSLSLRTSMFLLNVHKPTEGFLWSQTYFNRHPIDSGHKAMADLAVHLIQEVALGLVTSPMSAQEQSWRSLPLPPPMHAGNYEPKMATCLVGSALLTMNLSSDGWQWTNEGIPARPKWGFVSTQPGSVLLLQLGTLGTFSPGKDRMANAVVQDRHQQSTSFPVLLQYLVSYNSMGQGYVDCLGGCNCKSVRVNAHKDGFASVINLLKLDMTWQGQEPCNLRITVLNETNSGAHKFKVSGVVLVATATLTSSHGMENWSV